MESQDEASNKPFKVFHNFRFLLRFAGFNEGGLYTRYFKIPNVVLFLNLTVPMVFSIVMGFCLYCELHFDPQLISQSFTTAICAIQSICMYSCLIMNRSFVLQAIDHLRIVAEKSRFFKFIRALENCMGGEFNHLFNI